MGASRRSGEDHAGSRGDRNWGGCRLLPGALAFLLLCGGSGCATTKMVVQDAQRVAHGDSVDRAALSKAFASDRNVIGGDLEQLRENFAHALARLQSNVRKHWGRRETRVASRKVYVKYTEGYRTRVVTDFDHGTITIETLDSTGSLRRAIVAALLTPDDPAAVDLFSDDAVRLEAGHEPYLYGLVRDNHGRSIRTRSQAERFAAYLVAARMRTRSVSGEQGAATARFVELHMVRDFEARSVERYRPAIERYAARYGVSSTLVLAIIRTESNFNPFAVSAVPAYGLMQLVPTSGGREALRQVRGTDEVPTPQYLFDPDRNIELGTAYLGELSSDDFGSIVDPASRDYCVIAAYNTGPWNVMRAFGKRREAALQAINAMPSPMLFEHLETRLPSDETRVYVVRVTRYRREFTVPVAPAVAAAVSSAGPAASAAAGRRR